MPKVEPPTALAVQRARWQSGRSTLIALCARDGGSGWPIALAGYSYALLGFTGALASGYRKRLHARLAP